MKNKYETKQENNNLNNNPNDNSIVNNTSEEDEDIQNIYGSYSFSKNHINEYNNGLKLSVKITLNEDNTATYEASTGYDVEKTKGSYLIENKKITYNKEYYNYDAKNGQINDAKYDDLNTKTLTFTIIDNNTIKQDSNYHNQEVILKK